MCETKWILFLGCGEQGLPCLEWANDIGFNVLLNDRNKDSQGHKMVDQSIYFDSTDSQAIYNSLKDHEGISKHLAYVHTSNDFGILAANEIMRSLKIITNTHDSVLSGLNKNLMKSAWSKGNIKTPKSKILKYEEIPSGWDAPFIVKPTDGQGSVGVQLVQSMDDFRVAFKEAYNWSKSKEVLIEEFIEGTHHDVNGLFWNGKFYRCGIGDRYFTPFPYCVPKWGNFPTTLELHKVDQIYDLVQKAAHSMGIEHGPIKGDIVIRGDDIFIYELSPRFHGDIFTVRTLEFLKDLNPLYQFFKLIYDSEYSFKEINSSTGYGVWKTLFQQIDAEDLSKEKMIIKRRCSKTVKNNAEIMGLAWDSDKNLEEAYKKLSINLN